MANGGRERVCGVIVGEVGGEWAHLGLGSASECGRETLLDRGVEGQTVLALRSAVAMLGRKPAMEERREEGREDEG